MAIEATIKEIRCKSFQGHRWDDPPVPPGRTLKNDQVYERCERCGVEKIVTVDRNGMTRSRYIYPDSYRSAEGVTKRDWNREWMRRIGAKK